MQLVAGKSIATFKGGGLSFAEDLMKKYPEKYQLKSDASAAPDLSQLSCRWNPIASKKGRILTLIVSAREKEDQTYKEILESIQTIIGDHLSTTNPLQGNKNMTYKGFWQNLLEEARLHTPRLLILTNKRFLAIFFSFLLFKLKIPLPFFDIPTYQKSLGTHADYQKFSDILRMVIDCSPEESRQIQDLLGKAYQDKKIHYGVFESDHSLMTCLVGSMADGDHIHFIDGGGGGYAFAAKKMKEQMLLP